MTHGYMGSSVTHMRILKGLAEEYRLVLFDNLTWGLNSRDGADSTATQGPELTEKYILDWCKNYISALGDDLPETFLLTGHSFGGYMAALIASMMPERVEALFLISPAA